MAKAIRTSLNVDEIVCLRRALKAAMEDAFSPEDIPIAQALDKRLAKAIGSLQHGAKTDD